MAILETAANLADIGFFVFPVNGKVPKVRWAEESTRDVEKIHAWWTRWPDAGIGVDTGKSGVVVVDLDIKGGVDGVGNWKRLNNGRAPATYYSATPSGGWHVWYRDPEGKYRNSASEVAPGVDVRAVGGYVVAPGSPGYSWHAEMPLSLDDIIALPDGILPVGSVNGTGHWTPLDRDTLDPRDLAALEALERLGGHEAYAADGYVAVTRPGKRSGSSASIGHIGPGIVRVFSPHWPPLKEGGVYTVDDLEDLAKGLGVTKKEELSLPSGLSSSFFVTPSGVSALSSSFFVTPSEDNPLFYGITGEIVRALDPLTEAHPIGVLGSLLAGTSSLLNRGPHIRIGSTRHPLLIWPLLFGSTSRGRKGDATNTAREILEVADVEILTITATGLSSGEGLIQRVRDPDDKDPGVTDKRLFVIESEFSSVMARSKREGNTLAGILRDAWDGRPLSVITRKPIKASGSHIAVLGHVTAREFRTQLAESELAGGTYNRFLPLWVERTAILPFADPPDPKLVDDLGGRLGHAINEGRKKLSTAPIGFTTEARTIWPGLYEEFLGYEDDGALAQFTQRAAPYCRRLAALYAVLDGQDAADVAHFEAAAALVRYSMASARHVLQGVTGDPRLDLLRTSVQNAGDQGMTRTEISALFSRNLTSTQLDDLLTRLLEDAGIEEIERATAGRSATVYRWTGPTVTTGITVMTHSGSSGANIGTTGTTGTTEDSSSVEGASIPATVPCAACGDPMTVLEPGQTTHPACDPHRGDPEPGVATVVELLDVASIEEEEPA